MMARHAVRAEGLWLGGFLLFCVSTVLRRVKLTGE